MLRDVLAWLGETPWSIALHESLYMWPLTESAHVLTLALFAGTAAVLDLRMLGLALGGVPVSALTGRLLPWTRAAFVVMVVTGLALFYATPLTYYHSLFFRIKVLLLGVAGVNILVFHARTVRGMAAWDHADRPPRAARAAAMISLLAWAGVIVSGRLVAYNWFECAIQPQSAIVNWLQECPVTPP
ncbi:MAG: hypothetical protein FJ202_01400 [Gemmatimonadetes bacterium]|nr:hypothetical protein [Gemmatimonadota bacterium]